MNDMLASHRDIFLVAALILFVFFILGSIFFGVCMKLFKWSKKTRPSINELACVWRFSVVVGILAFVFLLLFSFTLR